MTFPTFGMAGIGIAAAIGFVFVLAFLSNSATVVVNDGGNMPQPDSTFSLQQQKQTATDEQESGDNNAALLSDEGAQSTMAPESLMMEQTNLQPTMVSITALRADGMEIIGEVVPDMQFAANEPVLIRANFITASEGVADLTIGIGKNATGFHSYEQAANFRGSAAANRSIELELYWNPYTTGEYRILLSSENLQTEQVMPIAEIPVRVIAAANIP